LRSNKEKHIRLANRDLAGHITWFLPIVLVIVVMIRHNQPVRKWPRLHRDAFFWTVWFLPLATIFSLPRIFIHAYYLALLAPAIAILADSVIISL